MDEDGEDDIEMMFILSSNGNKKEKPETVYGKGNAVKGYKAKYKLYPPSNVFYRVKYTIFKLKNRCLCCIFCK